MEIIPKKIRANTKPVKQNPLFEKDYPPHLVASLAVHFLDAGSLPNEEDLAVAAKTACKLIDCSHQVALEHYIQFNNWPVDSTEEVEMVSFSEAARQITGNKKRTKDAIENFNKYYATLEPQFRMYLAVEVPQEDLPQRAQELMRAELESMQVKGMTASYKEELTKGYKEWMKNKTLEARRTAGAKGGVSNEQRRQAKHDSSGKFAKKKESLWTAVKQSKLASKSAGKS